MYEVIDFKLLPGLAVNLQDSRRDFFNLSSSESTSRSIVIKVPDSGDQDISLIRYLVGEKITVRKSLRGLRIVKGLPDYSGAVIRVDLTDQLEQLVQDRKDSFIRSRHARESLITQNNLCMEIPYPNQVDWASLTSDFPQASYTADRVRALETGRLRTEEYLTTRPSGVGLVGRMMGRSQGRSLAADEEMISAMLASYTQEDIRNAYYSRSGRGGRSVPTTEEMSRRYTLPAGSDFDGDTLWNGFLRNEDLTGSQAALRRIHTETVREARTRFVDNRHEVAELPITDLIRATAELVDGDRATPPQSLGPRPRNQRW